MLRPGSIPWLVAWDLRLAWRGMGRGAGGRGKVLSDTRLLIGLLLTFVVMHLFGFAVTLMARSAEPGASMQLLLTTTALALSLLTATGAAMSIGINLLFVRNDLDLLCATPVPMRNVFAARSLSIVIRCIVLPALLFLPAADVAAVWGNPRWLASYPVMLCLGSTAAVLGLSLTLLLVRVIGPRAGRLVVLVSSVVLGASLFLALQLPNLLGHAREQALIKAVEQWLLYSPAAAADRWIWYPARAVAGEALPMTATLLAGAACFALAVLQLPRGFALALRQTAGFTGRVRVRTGGFRTQLWRVLFVKEWRSIYRDPHLLAQLAQRFIGLIPATLLLMRGHGTAFGNQGQAPVMALVTMIAGLLADILVWIAVCAEDAPELLAGAPRKRGLIRRMKLLVILLPIWIAMLSLAAALTWRTPWALASLVVAIAGVTMSTGAFHLWLPAYASRKDIRQRYQRGGRESLIRQLASIGIVLGWSGCIWGFASAHWLAAFVLLPVSLAGPVYAWWNRGEAADSGY